MREDWIGRTVLGFAALAAGRPALASRHWLRALSETERDGAPDPLRAAAQNNAGVAYLLTSRIGQAREKFTAAERLWAKTAAHIEAADLPLAGRSSAFHLHLAMHHQEAFAALPRQRYASMCAAALTITKLNAHLALRASGGRRKLDAADHGAIAALSEAFGERCAEIAILQDAFDDATGGTATSRGYAAYQAKSAYPNARQPRNESGLGADVHAAAHLTALVHPGLLPNARMSAQTLREL